MPFAEQRRLAGWLASHGWVASVTLVPWLIGTVAVIDWLAFVLRLKDLVMGRLLGMFWSLVC
jgi:hypothetical protein